MIVTFIRIDSEVKRQSTALFADLGLDMSTAVNLFLRQCIMREGLPFAIERPRYSDQLLGAAREARRISRDPSTPSYATMTDLKAALEE